MTFLHPNALWLELIAIAIIALYLRKPGRPREPASAGMFWDQVLAEEWLRRRWQRWRNVVSALVQLAILTLLVVALAEPDAGTRPPLWLFFAGAALALCAVEWCLYQRRWMS